MQSLNKIAWINDEFAPFLNKVQSHHVFDFCLSNIKYADETIISSFAINEAFVRRLFKHRDKLGKLTIIWDSTMATRSPKILLFLAQNADAIYIVPNHSKMISMKRTGKHIVSASSINTTGNYRYEGGIITTNKQLVDYYHSELNNIINDSVKWTKF